MGRIEQKGMHGIDYREVPVGLLGHPGNPLASEYRSNSANRERLFAVQSSPHSCEWHRALGHRKGGYWPVYYAATTERPIPHEFDTKHARSMQTNTNDNRVQGMKGVHRKSHCSFAIIISSAETFAKFPTFI